MSEETEEGTGDGDPEGTSNFAKLIDFVRALKNEGHGWDHILSVAGRKRLNLGRVKVAMRKEGVLPKQHAPLPTDEANARLDVDDASPSDEMDEGSGPRPW